MAWKDTLSIVESTTADLIRLPVPLEATADVAGRVRKLERDLADFRRGLVAETGPQTGLEYRLVEARSASRTYNTAAILHDHNPDLWAGLLNLKDEGAVRLSWQWSRLVKVFGDELRVARHEIEDDGDLGGPHVGEVWASTVRLEGLTE